MGKYELMITCSYLIIACAFIGVQGASPLIPKPKICSDFLYYSDPEARVVTLYDDNDQPFQTICRREGNMRLTMLESFNKTTSLHTDIAHPFSIDSPIHNAVSSAPFPISLFRLSKDRMVSLANKANSISGSCVGVSKIGDNYNFANYEILRYDSDWSSRKAFFDDLFRTDTADNCITVKYLRAFNKIIQDKKMPLYSRPDIHVHLSLDEALTRCDKVDLGIVSNATIADECSVRDFPANAPKTYNLFGSYNKCTRKFSCSSSDDAISSWWAEEILPTP